MGKFQNLVGKKYGRLTVIERGPDYRPTPQRMKVQWWCKCDCDNPDMVLIKAESLRNGETQSCGCLHKERASAMGRSKKLQNDYEIRDDYAIGKTNKGDLFYFDLEDYDLVSQYCWHKSTGGYIVARFGNKHIKLHRLVMGAKPGDIIDHINHCPEDNRKSNLRFTTREGNGQNRALLSNNTSGYPGVVLRKRSGKWEARIRCNGIIHNLGTFNSKTDAINARKEAENEYFKEFSYSNSIASSTLPV